SGTALLRPDLSAEAIRLGRLIAGLLPLGEVNGLLALVLFNDSRRAARATADGDIVLLDEQDRGQWDRAEIEEGLARLEAAEATGQPGPYTLQAGIAAVHATSATPAATDWKKIVALYDRLVAIEPSPVVALNRAAAVAMRDGPEAGLALIDALIARGGLDRY